IIYVSGSGFGMNGPDRDAGAYDATAFWARGGSADGVTPPGSDSVAFMPAGAYGDNIGGLAIAGGVAAALFGRQATGEPSVLDVSLLAVGAWTTQFSVNMAMLQPTPYWPEFCLLMGLDEYAADPRFESLAAMAEQADIAYGIVHDAIAKLSFAECKELLS